MKLKITAFLHWHKYECQEKPDYQYVSCDMSNCGVDYVLIRKDELEIDVPDDFDPRPKQVEALRNEKQKILAETNVKVGNIDEQIERLLCIEHKP